MTTRIVVQKPPGMGMSEFLDHEGLDEFDGVQLYLGGADDFSIEEWLEVKRVLDSKDLDTIVHLSNPYTMEELKIARVLGGDLGIFVLHYEEGMVVQPSAWGILGLENARFGVDEAYHDRWLYQASKIGRLPVFDIPRLFRDTPAEMAIRETERILSALDHYLVHLIDFSQPRQHRIDFVPMGQGVLGPILAEIRWPRKPVAVVLEFEDFDQSLRSLHCIRDIFSQ